MNKLSSREKTLIVALLITAILVIGYLFVIRPVLDERAQNQTIIAEKQREKQALQEQIAMLGDLEKKLKASKEFVGKNQVEYFKGNITTWNAERYVTALLEKNNISVMSIAIVGPDPFEITPALKKDENGNEVKQEPIKTDIKKVSLSVSFGATLENFVNYLDALKKDNKKIAINSWSYQVKDGTMTCTLMIDMYCA